MKALLFICSLFAFSIGAAAQELFASDSIADREVAISLKGKYHGIIYELMTDRGSTDAINYVNQVVKAVVAAGKKDSLGNLVVDTAQVIPITVPYRMVTSVYLLLVSNQERLTAQDNGDMKPLLKAQLSQAVDSNGVPVHWPLLLAIKAIDDQNSMEREDIRAAGIKKILSIKPQ